MLNRVVWALKENTGKRLEASLRRLTQDIESHAVKVEYVVCCGEGQHMQSQADCFGREHQTQNHSALFREKDQVQDYGAEHGEESSNIRLNARDRDVTDSDKRNTLYITDSGEQYDLWHAEGRYVLPYSHLENQEENFSGAEYLIERLGEIDYEVIDMAYRRLAGIPWEILRTRRCIVRETIEEDVDSLYRIYAEPAVSEYIEKLYEDRDEEIAYIRDYRRKMYGFYGYGIWTVLTRDEGRIIGRAGISWREEFDVPELGFVFGRPWQGQGYAYEVCSAILDYAWKDIGFKQMQALVMEHNEKSAALCRKLGFEDQGITIIEGARYILYKMRVDSCGQ